MERKTTSNTFFFFFPFNYESLCAVNYFVSTRFSVNLLRSTPICLFSSVQSDD